MILLAGAAACGGHAQTRTPAQAQELFLEVVLNRVTAPELAPFTLRGGGLAADAATLRALGLKWPGSDGASGLVPLDGLPGLQARYDADTQQLHLTAPPILLDRPTLKLATQLADRALVDPATRVPGLVFNYDLYAQRSQGKLGGDSATRQSSLSAITELRLFGVGPGTWRNLMSHRAGDDAGVRRGEAVRLETAWQRDFPDDMVSLTVGDTITGAPTWSRATRLGGIQLARAFSLQPYRSLLPVASFQGSAVLPSTVDLFINGMRQSSQQVPPGDFQLGTTPTLNGAGQASVVITDINGQRRVLSFDLYAAPQLLQEGLTDWSLDAGAVRRDFGVRSFAYDGQPVLSASVRHGWRADTTLEGHAQAAPGLRMAGAGAARLLGRAGVASVSLAASQRTVGAQQPAPSSGIQRAFGYQYSSPRYNVSLNSRRAGAGFADVASVHGTPLSRGTDTVYAGFTSAWGQFGLGLVRQLNPWGQAARFVSATWSRQLPGDATLSVSLNRNPDGDAGTSAFVALSVPIGHQAGVSVAAQSAQGVRETTAQAWRMPSADEGGWGWRVQGRAEGTRPTTAQGEVSRLGSLGQWTAGLSQTAAARGAGSGATTVHASASGALVWMGERAWATRRVDDALALVSTNGIAGVPIRLGGRLVGTTDSQGMLLVTPLYAYQRNRMEIDTLALPADLRIAGETMDGVPEARSGIRLRFPLRRVRAVQLALQDTQGAWIPPGSVVRVTPPPTPVEPQRQPQPPSSPLPIGTEARLDFSASAVVGYDGLVYLEDPAPGGTLRTHGAAGPCTAVLPPLPAGGGGIDLGTVTCR